MLIYFSTRVCACVYVFVHLLASSLLDLQKSICGASQNRLHLSRSWRYCIASPGGGPDSAPFHLQYKQQSGVSWLSKTVQHKPSKTTPIQRQFYRNPIAIPQQPHKYTTLLPQQSHNNPKQRHSKVRHRRHTNPTAILHESQTITQQDRRTRRNTLQQLCSTHTTTPPRNLTAILQESHGNARGGPQ